jgi:hypothetical protein
MEHGWRPMKSESLDKKPQESSIHVPIERIQESPGPDKIRVFRKKRWRLLEKTEPMESGSCSCGSGMVYAGAGC